MSCNDIPSLLDLQKAKLNADDFGRLVEGTESGYSTNGVTGQIRPTWDKVIEDLGFKPGSGDFTTGFTVIPGQRNYARYDPISHNWYSYLGVIPESGYTVAPGTNPVGNINWKPVTDQTLRGELLSGAMEIRNNLMSLRDTDSVRDYGAIGGGIADDTAAFIASGSSGKPALVPFPIVKLTSDVAGQFYSYTPVKIVGTGYANISLLTLGDVRPSTDVTGEIEVFAHRGFAAQAPQNTILAFSQALANGADGLELDLQFSSDGVLYVFHDTTVDALTNGTGTFTSLTSATIDGLTFDSTVGTPFADESIPRFEEVLKLARRAGTKLLVELKNVWTIPQMTIVRDLLIQYGYNNAQCTIFAGFIVYCEQFRGLSQSVGIAYVHAGNFASTTPFINQLKVINGHMAIDQSFVLAEPSIVTYAYSKGVDLWAWTIISAEQAKLVADIGIRKVISDVSFGGAV